MVTYLAKELWKDLNFPFEKVSSPFQLDWTGAVPRDLFVDPSVSRFWKAIINQLILLLILSIFPINKETLMDLQFYNEE